jgi:hypothetical protein
VLWGKAEDANGGQVGSKQTADADGIAVTVDTPTNLSEPLLPTVAEPVFWTWVLGFGNTQVQREIFFPNA